VAGQLWRRYSGRSGASALVLVRPSVTVIVVGTAPERELRTLAGSLA
jgi:hypothetical protein